MLSYKKLMVGNYFRVNGNFHVLTIISEGIPLDLEPIRLSKYWLDRLGFGFNEFENHYYGFGLKVEDRGYYLSKFPSENQKRLKGKFGVFYDNDGFIKNIEFVHELQCIINLLV